MNIKFGKKDIIEMVEKYYKEILDITGGFPYQGGAVDLEAKMEEVVDMDPSIYQSMAIKAQEKAVQNFSNEANVQGVYNLYKLILSKNQ